MLNVQDYFDKNPSDSYAKHNFISVPLETVAVNANIKTPFKWFFSYYVRTTPHTNKTMQRAFKKLSIITEVPREETDKFKSFQEELKNKSDEYPWFSKTYQGCLLLYDQCIFHRSTAKVSSNSCRTVVVLSIRTIKSASRQFERE